MFIHHIATIVLMSLSWVVNVFRVGCLVLVIHDSADIFLEVSAIFLTFISLKSWRYNTAQYLVVSIVRFMAC